jgi:DNA-binding response OmpR family regulator
MYIGLLEDEPHLAQHVCDVLSEAGHTVTVFGNGEDMVRAVERNTFDLFVLDWRVPRMSGIEVLKHLRTVRNLNEPVLFLTSRTDEQDIVEALNSGADDYCTKPIRPREFLARVNSLIRRTYPDRTDDNIKTINEYKFDRANNTIGFDGKSIAVSEKEFKLAIYMFENIERAMSRERLIQEIWGTSGDDISRSLDVHISWLRKKLDLSATSPKYRLKPIYGFGYRLMAVDGAQDE